MTPNPHSSPLDSEADAYPVVSNPELDSYLNQVASDTAGAIDKVPHLEYSGGRKTADSSATAAVMALQPCITAEKARAMENLYLAWRFDPRKLEKRAEQLRKVRDPFMILRELIALLATALQESIARENAAGIQQSIGAEHLRMCEDLRALRKFLYENYPKELQRAVDLNEPLLELVKRLLLPPASAGEPRGYGLQEGA